MPSSDFPRNPADLRVMSVEQLEYLATDIRQRILNVCLKNGGHLGASLGAVELAIALHRVFQSPAESIAWDVGHQAYAHKLLTGRSDRFETLRAFNGISGFLSRGESEHDVFGGGHASTVLSAALGIAWANYQQSSDHWTIAVIGDGGLTGGLAFEALNNFRARELAPFLLVVNDNQMSISPNVGAVPAILSGGNAKEFFSLFGFDYVGPIDGHDLRGLLATLHALREERRGRPVVLHVLTQKGKGYIPAEELPSTFHGVAPLHPSREGGSSFSDAFGAAICELASNDPRIVAITAAMPEGTGLDRFARAFPSRFFDVGIAESHAVTFAAGLATKGYRPVVAVYSTFLQRAFDQVIHDVALQKLGVTFAIDRAGIVGADGPTHHGMFDLAYLGMIPGMRVAAPACLSDIANLLAYAVRSGEPFAIRYPRGEGPRDFEVHSVDGLRWHRKSRTSKLIVVALGGATERALEAVRAADSDGKTVSFVSVTRAKPLPESLVDYLKANRKILVLTVEDGVARGGFGQSLLAAVGSRVGEFTIAGYQDHFVPHGSTTQLEEHEELSSECLKGRILELLGGEEAN